MFVWQPDNSQSPPPGDFSPISFHPLPCLASCFVTPCFCFACRRGTAWLSSPPQASGWVIAFLLFHKLPAHTMQAKPPSCPGWQALFCSPPLGCCKPTVPSQGIIPTARSPEALLLAVICGWLSATLCVPREMEPLAGQMHRTGTQKRDGAWEGSWRQRHMVGHSAEPPPAAKCLAATGDRLVLQIQCLSL